MSVYYQDDKVTLYHGDCLVEHREWLDANVLITDPPYGTQFTKANPRGGYGRRKKGAPDGFTVAGDKDTTTRDSVLTMWGERAAAIFGSPRMPEPPGTWTERLIWDKVEPGMNGGPFRYTHENIYLRDDDPYTHENIFLRGDGWREKGRDKFSILRFPRSDGMGNEERSEHAHRKPVGLMEALIEAYPEGTIADPFAGSGSTLVAAKLLGRQVIGVEIEEKHCEVIARRLSQGVLDLFGGAA